MRRARRPDSCHGSVPPSAERLLASLALTPRAAARLDREDLAVLETADLVVRARGRVCVSETGKSYLLRSEAARAGGLDPFLAQHIRLEPGIAETATGSERVQIEQGESPLTWLARRKGRDGRAMISPHQLASGERLREVFTRAQLMPRVTSNWSAGAAATAGGGRGVADATDAAIAARERFHLALDAVGPEFAGLLVDVCCFLKRLEDVERERGWPVRSAKVVLQLGLDRLARHYGFDEAARGRPSGALRAWIGEDEVA